MQSFVSNIEIKVNPSVYLKDPHSSVLGQRIVSGGIDLLAELGFEQFTFRKLGKRIDSPEASVYRYFESKHKLLLYITSWYWGWMEYQLVFSLANISEPRQRLRKAIGLLTGKVQDVFSFPHINITNLQSIIEAESSKAYLSKRVDDENDQGVFRGYKHVVKRVSEIILEINPNYTFPQMLVSTIVEGAHHQRFFADHLPHLTNTLEEQDAIQEFYIELAFKAITK